MSKKKVFTGEERKAQILDAGAKLAAKVGVQNVTRRDVAKALKLKSEALVSVYVGTSSEAQKAYAKHARKLGLTLPSKAEADAIGAKMRAHGPRDKRDTRKRSAREVEAIKRKAVPAKKSAVAAKRSAGGSVATAGQASPKRASVRETKPQPVVRERKPVKPSTPPPLPSPAPAPQQAPERKSAARAPKAPPTLPPSS